MLKVNFTLLCWGQLRHDLPRIPPGPRAPATSPPPPPWAQLPAATPLTRRLRCWAAAGLRQRVGRAPECGRPSCAHEDSGGHGGGVHSPWGCPVWVHQPSLPPRTLLQPVCGTWHPGPVVSEHSTAQGPVHPPPPLPHPPSTPPCATRRALRTASALSSPAQAPWWGPRTWYCRWGAAAASSGSGTPVGDALTWSRPPARQATAVQLASPPSCPGVSPLRVLRPACPGASPPHLPLPLGPCPACLQRLRSFHAEASTPCQLLVITSDALDAMAKEAPDGRAAIQVGRCPLRWQSALPLCAFPDCHFRLPGRAGTGRAAICCSWER